MKIHFIQQDPWVLPGGYLTWAQSRGHETAYTRCWLYEAVPETVDADLLVVLGGHQSPSTGKEDCGYFDAEAQKALIRTCIGSGMMVVGVCLGAQLVGEALGASCSHSPEREIGPVEARLTEAGRADPFFASFPPVFPAGEWHNDMPGLTEDSVIIAESDGCPRQIVRYGRYVYGFQTHMEFTHDIIAAALEDSGVDLKRSGRYVQTPGQLLAFDYTEMNALLAGFLDAMTEDYITRRRVTVPEILEKMIVFSEGNIHDIDHFIRVWTYAGTIGKLEGLDPETQFILEAAAVTHDIACPLCRVKYGRTDGKLQEEEGAALVREFLKETGMTKTQIERVAFLVGHHHTFGETGGIDHQILLEADYIANATENGCSREDAESFMRQFAKTGSGKRLLKEVFRL